ncbi:hypothetical protein U1Q18_021460 [Sarracenia purpurea var. burkii]
MEVRNNIKHGSSFRSSDWDSIREGDNKEEEEEVELQWAAIERLSTFRRLRTSLFENSSNGDDDGKRSAEFEGKRVMTDVTKLSSLQRRLFINKMIKNVEKDNLHFLQKLKDRIDR